MIDREDMLELTRRMTPSRCCFDRAAGAYLDPDGFPEGTYNIHFLKLDADDKKKQLELAKTVPFSETNRQLRDHLTAPVLPGADSMQQLLQAVCSCGLKNDALLDILYDNFARIWTPGRDFGIFLLHGIYDVPAKASDGQRLEDAEEIYDFLVCTICPLRGEYEAGKPEFGFLYPAFRNRSSDPFRINVYESRPDHPHTEWTRLLTDN